jgi:hypothetical protein
MDEITSSRSSKMDILSVLSDDCNTNNYFRKNDMVSSTGPDLNRGLWFLPPPNNICGDGLEPSVRIEGQNDRLPAEISRSPENVESKKIDETVICGGMERDVVRPEVKKRKPGKLPPNFKPLRMSALFQMDIMALDLTQGHGFNSLTQCETHVPSPFRDEGENCTNTVESSDSCACTISDENSFAKVVPRLIALTMNSDTHFSSSEYTLPDRICPIQVLSPRKFHEGDLATILTAQLPNTVLSATHFLIMYDEEDPLSQGFSVQALQSTFESMKDAFTKHYIPENYLTEIGSVNFMNVELSNDLESPVQGMKEMVSSDLLHGIQNVSNLDVLSYECHSQYVPDWSSVNKSIDFTIKRYDQNISQLSILQYLPWIRQTELNNGNVEPPAPGRNSSPTPQSDENLEDAFSDHAKSPSSFIVPVCEDTLDDELSAFMASEGFLETHKILDLATNSAKSISFTDDTNIAQESKSIPLHGLIQGNQRVIRVQVDDNSPLAEVLKSYWILYECRF